MQEIANNEMSPAPVSRVKRVIVLGASALAGAVTLVGPVAADVNLSEEIGPILTGVIALIPTIIDLMVAAVPAIIIISIIAFITGFLDGIIKQLNFR